MERAVFKSCSLNLRGSAAAAIDLRRSLRDVLNERKLSEYVDRLEAEGVTLEELSMQPQSEEAEFFADHKVESVHQSRFCLLFHALRRAVDCVVSPSWLSRTLRSELVRLGSGFDHGEADRNPETACAAAQSRRC